MILVIAIAGGNYLYHIKKDSADGRLLIWKISLTLLPSFQGQGLGTFPAKYGEAQANYFCSAERPDRELYLADCIEYAFNEYLQIWIELGIIPFLLFLVLIYQIFYTAIKRRYFSGLSLLMPLLIFAFVSYPFSILPILIIAVMYLSLCSAVDKNNNETKKRFWNNTAFILIISFGIVSACIFNRYPTYQAYKQWKTLTRQYEFRRFQETVDGGVSIEPYLNDQVKFMMIYSQALYHVREYEKSNRVADQAIKYSCEYSLYLIKGRNYQNLGEYQLAEQNFIKASHIVPNRIYPHYHLAKLYTQMEDFVRAQEQAQIVINKPAKVESNTIKAMRKEMKDILFRLHGVKQFPEAQ